MSPKNTVVDKEVDEVRAFLAAVETASQYAAPIYL